MTRVDYVIRRATRSDLHAIDALLRYTYPRTLKTELAPSVLVTAVPLIARLQPSAIAAGCYFVADAGPSGLIGAGGWTLWNPTTGRRDARTASVRHFVTHPAMQRRGVGSRLMTRCVIDAAAANLDAMTCMATSGAIPFYERHGFLAVADVVIELRAGIRMPATRMDRPL